jgi:Domain of unknown function (DUF4442)
MDKSAYLKNLNSPWRMRLYLLLKLPAAWFMGIGVRSCTEQRAVVRLPYGWRSQNPFRSIYFAAQCAAGELSTGILGQLALREMPPMSMLVTRVEAEFYKKADKALLFTCEDGAAIAEAVLQARQTGEARTIRAESTGRLPDGTEAARVWITWSFKVKSGHPKV